MSFSRSVRAAKGVVKLNSEVLEVVDEEKKKVCIQFRFRDGGGDEVVMDGN